MKFKIDLNIPIKRINEDWPSFFMIGSCFANVQAQRMKSLRLNVDSNPFGIIYNPSSVSTLLDRISNQKLYKPEEFISYNEEYLSWEHHGKFKYDSIKDAVSTSNAILEKSRVFLKTTNAIVITLGTSLVFTYNNSIVANCHKLSNKQFKRKQLSARETSEHILACISHIRSINKTAEIVFTVSPIRHIRSGITESSRSKAVLISSIYEALEKVQDQATSYFPSYEIFIDELRDYRFVKEDLVHPTDVASLYIWDKFKNTYFAKSTLELLADIQKLNTLESHRSRNQEEHEASINKFTQSLKLKYPNSSIL